MPLTIKELRAGVSRPRNVASLVGGYVIALGCFVLFVLVASHLSGGMPSWPVVGLGAGLAAGIGVWIRLADL